MFDAYVDSDDGVKDNDGLVDSIVMMSMIIP